VARRGLPATTPREQVEDDCRQYLTMIESMLRDGRSEREIVDAVEEATSVGPQERRGSRRSPPF
jgi:hypothetical protein